MKVCLIFTSIDINPHNKAVAFRDERLGFVPPISLLLVAALLERIRAFGPDLLGFTVTTWSFHSVLGWIKRFKADTAIPVLVGGEHLRLYPFETMSYDAIDFCIIGEAELPLPEFIRAFREGSSFEGIKSLGYRKDGRVIIDRTLQFAEDINTLPFPARHLIKNERYENILSRKKNFTALISSRGCPFNCAFCSHNQLKYRARSPQNVVDEIELNLKKYAIRDFDIYDLYR
jgi:anaerobic magnesium-protoporphyrin IX monomethyl ester cyclase